MTSPVTDHAPPATDSLPGWIAWGQLVRLPNVFTVLADVGAAYLVVGQGPIPVERFGLILVAGVALYWAGMILNDVFDVDVDREQRSQRPLAAGQISVGRAKAAGMFLIVLGILAATASGRMPDPTLPMTWLPAITAIGLTLAILAYDGPLKKTVLAPATMGLCRVLSFLLGASPHFAEADLFPTWVLAFAIGMGVYVMGVTLVGRREAIGDDSPNLMTGTVVIAIGGAAVAYAPMLDPDARAWFFSPGRTFGLMILMVVAPVLVRGWRASQSPSPQTIQFAVRSGVLTIIPLSAAIAFLGAGPFWGLLIFAGVLPSLTLARYFRVT